MLSTTARRRTPAVFAAAVLAAALAGCGGGSSDSGSQSPGAQGSAGAAAASLTVNNAEFNWSAANITNAILQEIASRKPELGVKDLKNIPLGPAPAWAGATRGDIDMLTEVALPNQQKLADQAKDKVSFVSQTYGDAQQGWFVPKYMVEPGGVAEGLKSVDQLNEYKDKVGGKLIDGPSGYITTEYNAKRLKGYGLNLTHVKVEEAALQAELKRAYERKDPILVFLYHPLSIFAQLDLVQLEEPNPFTEGCLTTGDGKCAHSSYSANIAVSNQLKQQAPKFVDLMSKFKLDVPEMEQLQKQVEVDKQPVEQVAKQWVDKNSSKVDEWTKG